MSTLARRKFLKTSIALSALPAIGFSPGFRLPEESVPGRFKLSLNTYSFNAPLRAGQLSLQDVIEFCAAQNFEATDLTGYYFPGYPEVPSDDYLFTLKRKAHALGVAISGTGIRTDFAQPDKNARAADVMLTKKWIEVAAKLGAPVIRIFAGRATTENFSRESVMAWLLEDIRTCVEFGKKQGVIVAVQNHNDFLKTADQTIELLKKVNSEWFGLVLDTGSFVTNEPYAEMKKSISYAVNWQIKEKLNYGGKNDDMDLVKLFEIIKASNYRGYLPIETLSPGDPHTIIPPFLKKVRDAMMAVMG